jgi:hypothetical protein
MMHSWDDGITDSPEPAASPAPVPDFPTHQPPGMLAAETCPQCGLKVSCIECRRNRYCERCAYWTLGELPARLRAFMEGSQTFTVRGDEHGHVGGITG